jgi:nickel transport protein
MTTDPMAHQLTMVQETTQATRLTLSYADASPFAFESYELYREDLELPVQTGRTDAQGRIAFIPDTAKDWRIRAFSEDGHGIDRRFTINATTGRTSPSTGINRWFATIGGLGVLFGLFGLYHLLSRQRADSG